jgi:hypothetical protein
MPHTTDSAAGVVDPSSVAAQQKALAQNRLDSFQKSELAHLIQSATNHAQAASEQNAKKAEAIYEEVAKNQNTAAFASVNATSKFTGKDETLTCNFTVDLKFSIYTVH